MRAPTRPAAPRRLPRAAHPPAPTPNSARSYEWNARTQVTTWNPTYPGSTNIPGGPIDYASKHWSGLISGYYGARAAMALRMAAEAAAQGAPWDPVAWDLAKATHATEFQLSTTPLPVAAVGDYLALTDEMLAKYGPRFEPFCGGV